MVVLTIARAQGYSTRTEPQAESKVEALVSKSVYVQSIYTPSALSGSYLYTWLKGSNYSGPHLVLQEVSSDVQFMFIHSKLFVVQYVFVKVICHFFVVVEDRESDCCLPVAWSGRC